VTDSRQHTRIRDRRDLKEFIEADLRAQHALGASLYKRRTKATLRFLRALRIAEYHARPGTGMVSRVLRAWANLRLRRISLKTGISIPPGTFGKGLGVPHYGGIVVHARARFGDYCCLQNGVNIGQGADGIPTGGDFVYIAPGAVLYGDIWIGSRSVIGANAVVGKDVPESTTWAGVPARQISTADSSSIHLKAVRDLMAQG
jgi:serine O-acetyltransferase